MVETATRASIRRKDRPLAVSATALAQHLDCSRANVHKLEAEGILRREADGFLLDQCRVAYIRFLRRERRQSPRNDAAAEYQRARARWIELKVLEREEVLMPVAECDAIMDNAIGIVLRCLHSIPHRLHFRDLHERRRCEAVIREVRRRNQR